MSNEANIIELHGGSKGNPMRFNCADSIGIEKGQLLVMNENNGVGKTASGMLLISGSTTFAGIANAEKVANDGSTTIGVWTSGIFDMYATSGAAITTGQGVIISGAGAVKSNSITGAQADANPTSIIGRALEDTTAGVGETIQVAIGVY